MAPRYSADAAERLGRQGARQEADLWRGNHPGRRARQERSLTGDGTIFPSGFESSLDPVFDVPQFTTTGETITVTPDDEVIAGPVLTVVQLVASVAALGTATRPVLVEFLFDGAATINISPSIWLPIGEDLSAAGAALPVSLIRLAGEDFPVTITAQGLTGPVSDVDVSLKGWNLHGWGQPSSYPFIS